MNSKIYRCHSGLGELRVHVYTDQSGFQVATVDDTGREYYIVLETHAALGIIKQLQEYIDETSESTPA